MITPGQTQLAAGIAAAPEVIAAKQYEATTVGAIEAAVTLRDERQRALDEARAEAHAAGGVVPRKHRLHRAELAEAVYDAEVAIEHTRRSRAGAVAVWQAAEAAASEHLAGEAERERRACQKRNGSSKPRHRRLRTSDQTPTDVTAAKSWRVCIASASS